MGDLWRFDLINNQWENMEVYGIATIKRTIKLWNGDDYYTTVKPDQKLKEDLKNLQTIK